MRIKVVACGVFEPELTELVKQTSTEIHLHFLDAGLHENPEELRRQSQAQIDAAVGLGYDAIVLGYGLCGRGTSGLMARDTRVVIPRVHDCMTLFLGSRDEYRKQFSRHPGTFYTTPGWYEKKALGDRITAKDAERIECVRSDPRFTELSQKFGETNAEYIIFFFDSWKRNYTRAAFIDTGVRDPERYERYARGMAENFGWLYESIPGDVSLLRDILQGKWDDSRVFVLEPGQRSTLTGDERIFAAIDVIESGSGSAAHQKPGQSAPETGKPPVCAWAADTEAPEPVSVSRTAQPDPDGIIGLGIDAGGTYTDCVIYDQRTDEVSAKSKALTTPHDLLIGINEALDALDIPDPAAIRLVALSTTLATNAIVETKGGQPGAIVMCSAIGGNPGIDWSPLALVDGEMTIGGIETVPPDVAQIEKVVDQMLAAGVDAFAISGYAGVKNPEHELLVKQVVQSRCDLPVVCGHELSSRLNFISRANTAILNARLLPLVRRLLDAVHVSLRQRGVEATITVVKGDGSLINRETALERPIETVLSGPAASVSGAKHLTGLRDAIILDMGGTTTDAAVIEGGLVRIDPEGARVGGWRTSVEAADISTVGLGGDSHLDFTSDRKLRVGPRRVIPLAYLCERHPEIKASLMAINPSTVLDRSRASVLDAFILARPDFTGELGDRDRAIVNALRSGPLFRSVLALRIGAQSPLLVRTDRLEELGVVQRSGLTPTDILHVTGEFTAWDAEAARHGLQVFSELFGIWPDDMIEKVRQAIVELIAGQIIGKEMADLQDVAPDAWPSLLHTVFRPDAKDVLRAQLSYSRPVVAIGAPVRPFFPQVGKFLNAQIVIPAHAEVANAVGAIASEVVVRERATIRPGEISNYVVHTRSGRAEHDDLDVALEWAKEQTADLARQRARQSGTRSRDVQYNVNERRAYSADGDQVLIEIMLETTVSGKPELKAAT